MNNYSKPNIKYKNSYATYVILVILIVASFLGLSAGVCTDIKDWKGLIFTSSLFFFPSIVLLAQSKNIEVYDDYLIIKNIFYTKQKNLNDLKEWILVHRWSKNYRRGNGSAVLILYFLNETFRINSFIPNKQFWNLVNALDSKKNNSISTKGSDTEVLHICLVFLVGALTSICAFYLRSMLFYK